MVKSCSAYNCKSRYGRNGCYTIHMLPKDETLRKKWVCAIQRNNLPRTAAICNKHFLPTDYFGDVIKRLKKGAVPSVFDFSSMTSDKMKRLKREIIPSVADSSKPELLLSRCSFKRMCQTLRQKLNGNSDENVATPLAKKEASSEIPTELEKTKDNDELDSKCLITNEKIDEDHLSETTRSCSFKGTFLKSGDNPENNIASFIKKEENDQSQASEDNTATDTVSFVKREGNDEDTSEEVLLERTCQESEDDCGGVVIPFLNQEAASTVHECVTLGSENGNMSTILEEPHLLIPVVDRPKRKGRVPKFDDFWESDLSCPVKRKRFWKVAHATVARLRSEKERLSGLNEQLKNRVRDLVNKNKDLKYKITNC